MNKRKKKSASNMTLTGTTGAMSSAASAAVMTTVSLGHHAPATLAFAAVLGALFPPALVMLSEAGARQLRGRNDRFLKSITVSWAKDEKKTHDEVAAQLEARKNDPDLSDAIWRAVRALLDATNEAVAVPLGVLVADYGRKNRPVDTFFRGTVRLLSELSAAELADLRGILDWVLTSTRRSRVIVSTNDQKQQEDKTWQRVPWVIKVRSDDPAGSDMPEWSRSALAILVYDAHPEDGQRLLMLLKAYGLGREHILTGLGGSEPAVELERTVVEHLARVLGAG